MSEASEDLDFYLMANLRPATTGLPIVIWVSERGNAQPDARIKVSTIHGSRIQPTSLATVAVRPTPHLVVGPALSSADQQVVFRWVALNEAALVDYWEGRIDTAELLQRLRRLPSRGGRQQ